MTIQFHKRRRGEEEKQKKASCIGHTIYVKLTILYELDYDTMVLTGDEEFLFQSPQEGKNSQQSMVQVITGREADMNTFTLSVLPLAVLV